MKIEQREDDVLNEREADDVSIETKEFSDTEIKKRLKNRSKGDLIKIIINLAKRVDELKAEKGVKDGK